MSLISSPPPGWTAWDKVLGQLQNDSLKPGLTDLASNSTVCLQVWPPGPGTACFFWKALFTPSLLTREDALEWKRPHPPQLLVPPTIQAPHCLCLKLLHSSAVFQGLFAPPLTLVCRKKHHTHPSSSPHTLCHPHIHNARSSKGPTQHTDNKAGVLAGNPWPKASSQPCPLRQMASSKLVLPGGSFRPRGLVLKLANCWLAECF